MDETLEFQKIILELAADLEGSKTSIPNFSSDDPEEAQWLARTMTFLRTEGSITQPYNPVTAFRFTSAGYQKYLPQINAWRAGDSRSKPKVISRTKGNLDLGFLYQIMTRLSELRADNPAFVMSDRLFNLVATETADADADIANYVDAHLEFLQGRGYVDLGQPAMLIRVRTVKLTTDGLMFVQPELAEFGRPSMLPEVVKSLEDQIQVLTYPPGEKEGLLYSLRDAIQRNAPELVAKILVELGAKAMRGGL
jgi:hypothetical protein